MEFDFHKGLAVNENSILRSDKGSYIYLVKDNKIKKQYVDTHTRTAEMIEIVSNEINEGDLVVIEGLNKISDGSSVNIIK